jgi:hypothetical protein
MEQRRHGMPYPPCENEPCFSRSQSKFPPRAMSRQGARRESNVGMSNNLGLLNCVRNADVIYRRYNFE